MRMLSMPARATLPVFALLFTPSIDALSPVSRRHAVLEGIVLGSGGALLFPKEANAAKGAAELDFEYYMRDLVGGNKREGTVQQSSAPPVPPPREVTNPLRLFLLNDNCSVDCLSTLALVEAVIGASPAGPAEDPRILEKEIQKRMKDYREKAKKSFYSKAPWKVESVSDQYYFDLTAYALWRTAADMLPNYKDREMFVRKLGRFIYKNAVRYRLLKTKPLKRGSLVGTTDCTNELLNMFTSNWFCKGYRLGETIKEKEDQRPIFDELDDDAIASGASVDCIVSVFEPATLGASLQITGEQSRFVPDFVGPTLAAMWETAGFESSWETFFLDPEYRPNPKDYYPTEQLFQYSLALSTGKSVTDTLSNFW